MYRENKICPHQVWTFKAKNFQVRLFVFHPPGVFFYWAGTHDNYHIFFPKFWEFETFSLPSFCIFRHPCRYSPFIFFSWQFDLVLAKIWIRLRQAHNRTTWWSNDPNAESLMRVSIPAIKIIKTVTRSLPSTGFDYWAAHVGWTANQNIRLLPEPMSLPINDLS